MKLKRFCSTFLLTFALATLPICGDIELPPLPIPLPI